MNICEFGYVVTDELFEIKERNNMIINPGIRKTEWDWWVVKNVLKRKIDEYEQHPLFPEYYQKISELLAGSSFIFGYTLDGDIKALIDDCRKYELPSLDFDYYDIRDIFKKFSKAKKYLSIENMLSALELQGDSNIHDAEADAFNSMISLKKIIDSLKISVTDIPEYWPNAHDRTENYSVGQKWENRNKRNQSGDGEIVYSCGETSRTTLGDLFGDLLIRHEEGTDPGGEVKK